MKSVFLYSNGCLENIIDLNLYGNIFSQNGWLITEDIKKADLILCSTCATNRVKEMYALSQIRRFRRKKKKGAELVVCGCLPDILPGRLKQVFNGRVFGPRKIEQLYSILGVDKPLLPASQNTIFSACIGDLNYPNKIKNFFGFLKKHNFPLPHYLERRFSGIEDPDMFYIRAGIGCLGNCSYCGIKKAKGDLISKPAEEIIKEFEAGLSLGYKRFVLSGDDLGCYGQDINCDLPKLLQGILNHKGEYEIAIRFIEPLWLIKYYPELRQFFKTNKIFSFCAPIQSGSNRILKLMNRHYMIEETMKCLKEIRRDFPRIMLRTHFIIGFPTETEEDFLQSLKAIDEIDFDLVIPAVYHNCPDTVASGMSGQVPALIKRLRFTRMLSKVLFNLYLNRLRFNSYNKASKIKNAENKK